MALLDSAHKLLVGRHFINEVMTKNETININKADIAAAIAALDQFLEDNQAAINSAIPLPARTSLSTVQKARLLAWVIYQRYQVT